MHRSSSLGLWLIARDVLTQNHLSLSLSLSPPLSLARSFARSPCLSVCLSLSLSLSLTHTHSLSLSHTHNLSISVSPPPSLSRQFARAVAVRARRSHSGRRLRAGEGPNQAWNVCRFSAGRGEFASTSQESEIENRRFAPTRAVALCAPSTNWCTPQNHLPAKGGHIVFFSRLDSCHTSPDSSERQCKSRTCKRRFDPCICGSLRATYSVEFLRAGAPLTLTPHT